ncbi:hypothetical protein [Aquimarina algiphila]|uniref:Uncharacterized protein n=1 Tax=Aquimarina algiphila TaxID=2047982 RepID=A0A554VB81_9FLAO|nr:hypothetical protein [Aquimarina algiphila]TSE03735.1 hypothetical protein FOF46_28600 [Aquimarina algiphila]
MKSIKTFIKEYTMITFLENILDEMRPITSATILWLLFITVVFFSFFFFLGFEYSGAQYTIK